MFVLTQLNALSLVSIIVTLVVILSNRRNWVWAEITYRSR